MACAVGRPSYFDHSRCVRPSPVYGGDGAIRTAYSSVFIYVFYLFLFPLGGYKLIRYDHVKEAKRPQSLSVAAASGADGNGESKDSSPTAARSISRESNEESPSTKPTHIRSESHHERLSDVEAGYQEPKVTKRVHDAVYHQPRKPSPLVKSFVSPISTIISIECNLDNSDEARNSDDLYHPSDHGLPKSTRKGNLIPTTWHRERSHTSVSTATTIVGSVYGKESSKVDPQPKQPSSSPSPPPPSSPSPLISLSPISPTGPIEPSLPLPKVPPQLERTFTSRGKGERLWRLFHGIREYLTPPTLGLLSLSKMVLCPLIGIYLVQGVLVRHYDLLDKNNHMLQFTLMLMSGSPTSIICFVLALVWDRRTKNAGSEMAALIAVQYAVATVLVTVQSACMMYFLF